MGVLSDDKTEPHDLDHAGVFFSMGWSTERGAHRPRQSVLDLNKCTSVSDWVSGLLAVTACAGRERRITAATERRVRCEGQATSLCKRPGPVQTRQKTACLVPPTPSHSVVWWPWVGGGVMAGRAITVWREFQSFRWWVTYWRWGRCPWGRGPLRTPDRRFLTIRNLEREEHVAFQALQRQSWNFKAICFEIRVHTQKIGKADKIY